MKKGEEHGRSATPTLVAQLRDSRSSKRRAAARSLRKSPDPAAAAALLEALEKEIEDRRTWETQYQMIMALAACQAGGSRPLLEKILNLPLEPMVHLAAGHALVQLSEEIDRAVVAALKSGSTMRAEGAVRAVAMTRRALASPTIDAIIAFASAPGNEAVRFWACAGAAGWASPAVREFLAYCLQDKRVDADTRRAAEASLDGRYLKWDPL